MDKAERDAMRARNEALHEQIDNMLGTFEQQRRDLADIQEELTAAQFEAWSEDQLVRVLVNAAGVPLEVHLDPAAFKRSTPTKLGTSITEAAQAAARKAADRSQHAVAPIEELAGSFPDLSDLIPGAPSIKDLVGNVMPESPDHKPPPTPEEDEEDEDDYYRNRRYLEGR